jgi:ABC-2 type transport system ATP-binding protein
MSMDIAMRDLTLRYGPTVALGGLTLDLPAGKIYGLLGRNGSGKTSLLSVLAAFRRATSGTLTVDGVDPFENASVMRRTSFIRDTLDVADADRIDRLLRLAGSLRPTWDQAYAERLLDAFELPVRQKVSALSRGQRSALGVVLGLATRAPLIILDETYLGMDAAARAAFHRELLADYLEHPRTIILSTHLIDEVAGLFERVVILDHGTVVVYEETEALRARGVAVTGPAAAVETFVAGRAVLGRQRLGGTLSATLYGRLDDDERARARTAGLSLGPVGLQDLFIHLTGDTATDAREKEASR